MEEKDLYKDFWVNSQMGAVVFDPRRTDLSLGRKESCNCSGRNDNQYSGGSKSSESDSFGLSASTWFAIGWMF